MRFGRTRTGVLAAVLRVVRGVLPRALAEHDGDNVPTAQKTRGSCGFAPRRTAARRRCAWPPPRPLGHARPGWGCLTPRSGRGDPQPGRALLRILCGAFVPVNVPRSNPGWGPPRTCPRGLGARRGGSPNLGGPAEEAAEGFAHGPGDPGGLGSRRGHTRRSAEQRKYPSDEQAGGESNRAPKAPQIGLFGSAQKGKEATKRGLLDRVRNLNVSS